MSAKKQEPTREHEAFKRLHEMGAVMVGRVLVTVSCRVGQSTYLEAKDSTGTLAGRISAIADLYEQYQQEKDKRK